MVRPSPNPLPQAGEGFCGAGVIAVVGVQEGGVLSAEAAAVVGGARLVVGGRRHLGLVRELIRGEAMAWPRPMEGAVPVILGHEGPVVVLASGDPLWFGVASMLARHVGWERVRVLPAVSSFQLAAARMGWAVQEVACVSCCGRPVGALVPHLQPGGRLLVLSAGAETPGEIAALLEARGLRGVVTVLNELGGAGERVSGVEGAAALNVVAVAVEGPAGAALALVPGREEGLFAHDGQISKGDVRALTLGALAPRRGELLWDVGCGSGAVGIEWMLAHPANRAVGVEVRADRAARARGNAAALGVPGLEVVEGEAPWVLAGLAAPDAVFLGGGAHRAGVIEAAWGALRPGGRLVANAVALATEVALVAAQGRFGGTLSRIGIERLDRVGGMAAFRPALTVTQWRVVK